MHLLSSDFRQKSTKRAESWSTPQLVTDALTKQRLARRASGWSVGRAISSSDGCRTGIAVDLKLPPHNEFTWTALISKHAKCGQGRQALKLYEEMRETGVKPSSYTYVAALKACSSLHDLERAQQIHAQMEENGFQLDVYVGTTLVNLYAKSGSILIARRVFEQMPDRDVVSWNAMILGYAQMEEGEVALQLYERMRTEGLLPNERTFLGALKACSSLASWKEGHGGNEQLRREQRLEQVRALHSDLVKGQFESDLFLANMLVDVYAKCGSMADARSVFERIPCRDVVSWNAMILGYALVEEGEEALQLYGRMQNEGVVPDERTFLGALKACSALAVLENGNMGDRKCIKKWCLEQLRHIHSGISTAGSVQDVFVGNMLVDAYAKCGSVVDARHVFEMLPHRDVVSWTAMISGYVQIEEGDVALQLYERMHMEGVVPNDRTFVGALKACGIVAGLQKGKEIHAEVIDRELDACDSFVASSLIDMYSKCGSMEDAQQVFDALPWRSTVTWNALISGYARQGDSRMVLHLFDRMRWSGTQPEAITFVSVLTACSHMGLVDKGQEYFGSMTRDYGIIPTVEHCSCIVDLVGRAGQVEKAMAIAMTYKSNAVVWKSLLSACRKWGNVELGRQAFDYAVKLDSNDASVYILMWNIYAAADMWEDCKQIQAMRVNTEARNQPGQSWWTDLRGIVHTFLVGDCQLPKTQDVHVKLCSLGFKMKEEGYVMRYAADDEMTCREASLES